MAHRIKRGALRLFFAGQVVLFSYFYLFGSQGVFLMTQLQADNRTCKQQIEQLECTIAGLESEIGAWNQHAFYKEKVAREQLQMARKDDLIFYVE